MCMAINVIVQYYGGFLPDILLLTQGPIFFSKKTLNVSRPSEHPSVRGKKMLNGSMALLSYTGVLLTRSMIEGGRGCNNFVPVLGGDGTKTSPTGDIFDQLPRDMS